MSIPRSQPYRVTWPLTAEQADNIDQMFQLLFDDMRNGAIKIALNDIDKLTFTPETLFHIGDIPFADTTSHLTTLPDVATGNAVISGGVDVAPSWGKIGLTTHISGILPIANGGTNASSQITDAMAYYDGTSLTTSSVAKLFPGIGIILSNGNAFAIRDTATDYRDVVKLDGGNALLLVNNGGAATGGDTYLGTAGAVGGKIIFQTRGAIAMTIVAADQKVYIGTDPGGGDIFRIGGALTINDTKILATKTAFSNGAGVNTGTLTNAPAATNPTKWIPIDDNGTTRYIPAW